MPTTAVIAEKPSVARDLASVLDPGARRLDGYLEGRYIWTWVLGHLGNWPVPKPTTLASKASGRWIVYRWCPPIGAW